MKNDPNHKNKDKVIADHRPATAKPLTKLATNKTNRPFKTSVKSPKVKILIGKVKIIKIGLTIALRIPKTTATISAI